MTKNEIREFWNGRANLGKVAGTQDWIGKQIENEAVLRHIGGGHNILDVGCGNGHMAFLIAKKKKVNILGIDYAAGMIEAAKRDLQNQQGLKGKVSFQVQDIEEIASLARRFDVIYSPRSIINLPTWKKQKEAIRRIVGLLKPGGRYIMCENCHDGLRQINELRNKLGLSTITPPWHNRYLEKKEVERLTLPDARLQEVKPICSTYYFLSRIVNAWLAQLENREPQYDAAVNQLALQISAAGAASPIADDFSQAIIWVWRKNAA